ncbi:MULTISPECIES: NAD(P)/FAD-dependent oxidoreductase [unclassified Crossiella]|uniref:FAD-dependent oxidoreductase n=1 Tax=unclassified Crossiella TaxID=2620835 RepID=UPI001FFEFF08|nr:MULTISPECIES: FAD-dependent monooxygenase [unclassified Crossiella]MCK2244782.1 FAD-dependent monooxygenase [Crossiella sp. S99.2]MCK2258424.1 FAD-dependent monooxygenase [Crossiella sp. S99.1]
MRVVVVGAGLGGLAVANGLRRKGLDVVVLEARPRLDDTEQGYRININATGHAALHACLPTVRLADYHRILHRQRDPAVYLFDPDLRLLSRNELPSVPGAVDRGALRRVLAEGVADRITFGREVTSLSETGPADLVVAADGVGSALRRELLPHNGPEPLGWTAIFGRSPLDCTGEQGLPAASRAEPTVTHGGRLAEVIRHSRFCGVVDHSTVLALCAYNPPSPPARGPYLMWVLMAPTEELPLPGAGPADLLRFALRRTANWGRHATSALRAAIVTDTFRTPLRAMPTIPDLPPSNGIPVAFLGDAIHAMSPAGGEGANTALADAALLVSHLDRTTDLASAVAAYHRDMRVTAGAALDRSAGFAVRAQHIATEVSHV